MTVTDFRHTGHYHRPRRTAYGIVFLFEAFLFVIAAGVAVRVIAGAPQTKRVLTQGEFSCATM